LLLLCQFSFGLGLLSKEIVVIVVVEVLLVVVVVVVVISEEGLFAGKLVHDLSGVSSFLPGLLEGVVGMGKSLSGGEGALLEVNGVVGFQGLAQCNGALTAGQEGVPLCGWGGWMVGE